LLFMPVAGGPEESVASWMAGLARGGVETGFNRWTLARWQNNHPGARAFTVLRHPLLRAFKAWRVVQAGIMPAYARNMERTMKMSLPTLEADHSAQAQGFLAFLRYAKMNLAGQTAVAVPGLWASQAGIVESFGEFQPPDMILREDRIEAGLNYLAAEVGGRRRAGYTAEMLDSGLLAQLLDETMREAARAAWARDYKTFGFGDWLPDQAA
jgi:hypothetical protein